ELLKKLSSSTVTLVPTVETDWAFLLGLITITGISAANAWLKEKVKIRLSKYVLSFLNI
mgnify:CR=1